DGKKAFLFCPDGVVSALKQPFFSKNSKKDKHQNDVCLQSETAYRQFSSPTLNGSIISVVGKSTVEIMEPF
ncbi:hypothetical protein HO481_11970, partial [Streptococcus suis]|nr:hypothetical protein [Streptococcus suis]